MPARAFTPAQARQNAAFLASLARTGNARDTADALGVHRSTYLKRRARCPAFAEAWREAVRAARATGAPARRPGPHARAGGDEPPRIDAAAAKTFLDALADGATVRAAAGEAGFTHPSFYARAARDPAFARELALALRIGADRLHQARIDMAERAASEYLPIPAADPGLGMSAEQAILQLMFHQPDGRFQRSPKRARNRLPPPSVDDAKLTRQIEAHIRAFRRNEHYARTGSWRLPEE